MIATDAVLIAEALLRDAHLDDLAVQIRRRVAQAERVRQGCTCEVCQAGRAGMPLGWPREGGDEEEREQREAWDVLKRALDDDRLSDRPLFRAREGGDDE